MQHGYMSVPRLHCENTLTLPRDLSVVTAASGKRELRQHFVPELQVLRCETRQALCHLLIPKIDPLPRQARDRQGEFYKEERRFA
jgi:hypothetical protein